MEVRARQLHPSGITLSSHWLEVGRVGGVVAPSRQGEGDRCEHIAAKYLANWDWGTGQVGTWVGHQRHLPQPLFIHYGFICP